MCVYAVFMPTDAEITFADHMGRFYARRFSFPPMMGRLIGYLAVCDPPDPTIGELAEALLASRSAIAGAVKSLETIHAVQRSRVAGERMDRVRIDLSSQQTMGMDASEYEEMRELAREGLEVLRDATPERRAILVELSAFADFLVEQMPRLRQEWEARRAALVASGDLPEKRPGYGRQQ
jgi:DNA-binding transcriptional regulator GbsR (MarR family)